MMRGENSAEGEGVLEKLELGELLATEPSSYAWMRHSF